MLLGLVGLTGSVVLVEVLRLDSCRQASSVNFRRFTVVLISPAAGLFRMV